MIVSFVYDEKDYEIDVNLFDENVRRQLNLLEWTLSEICVIDGA